MSSPLCDLVLSWEAGSSNCPDASTLWYNVYRDTTPYFTPGPSNLIESTTEITCTDYLVDPMVTYYYIVRAEDSTTLNGGNHNGGNEDANTVMIMGTPWAAGRVPGTFSDDGGDTNAKLFLEGEWRVTNQENHTTGGTYSYHNAKDGNAYAAGQCAAATTPPLDLQPATSPVLSYWIRMNVEWEWDGVVTEISTDGGLSWSTLAPNETYPGDFSTGGGVSSPINACDYSLSQECFNGPSDNSGLTNWAQYTHNLAAYAGQTVQIRWNFSSDGGFEVEGFYLDDIQVTFASVNTDCATSDGAVALDRDTYNCDGDTISINVGDRDLRGNGTQNVTINSTTEPGGETVTLTESPANSGNFIGTITTTGSAPPSNGFLSLTHGDTITVMYVDADDGNGGIDVSKTDTATADCTPPMISNVQVINIGSSSATVTWDTNEVADSRVTYENDPSPSAYINYEGSYVTSHSLTLTGLYSCTKYFFFVESTDPSLNHALDDNSGSYYTFTTIVNTNPTYAASGLPLPIPDGNLTGVSSTISVPDDKTVVDVNVTLSITHPYDGDVDIYLIGPDLTQIALSLDHGSTGDNYTNTTFDDEAGTPIASGTPPFTGSFQPDQALSAFDLGSALGNWTLKVADDAGGDTGTLDAWSITFEYPPESCPTSDGTVELDDTLYGCSDALSVLLRDADLMGMGTVTVELFSDTETTPEDVSLSEDPAYSGIYTGTFTTSSTAPVHGDNLLSLSAGDTITVRYTDADDGLGGTDVVKTDTASAECQPPVISNVQVTSITDSSAVITWDTDESSDSRAVWSDTSPPSGSEASDTALVTSHSIPVTGLDPCTTYYFYVESTDIFSNTATDTNGASYYSFETYGTAQLFGPDDVEAGVGTWTPTSNTATIWHRDTCHAASGSYAWKAGASDAPTCTATYLASTTTDLESGTINLGSPGHSFHLLFNQWYETESGYDYCYVQISEDGGAYTDIVPRYAGSSGGWQAADYDLSAFSGPVKIRFRFTSDSGINREGWYIDDIEIRGPMPCGASLALDSYSFTDSCSGTGSGGDDIIDAGEDLEIVVTLFNNGIDPATGVQATLSSTTPGVTFPPSGNLAGFPDIDPLTGEVSLFPHFTVHVGNSVACDELLEFDLLITADDGGSWSDSFTLTTGLLTPPTPVSESFEPGVTPPALPSGWSVEQVNGGSGAWATRAGTRNPSGYASHSSPNLIYFNSYSVYSGNDVRLRTVNSFSTVGATDASLTFWMFHDDGYSTSNDRLQVQVSTDGTAFANVTGALFQRYDASEDSWQEHTVDLSAYLDEPYLWIGFVGISGYGNDIHLDDIVVTLAGTGGCSMTECQGVPDEVSASGSSFPLKIEKDSTMVACSTGYCLTFEKITTATGYNVYEGTLGNFYDHDSAGTNACDAAPSDLGDGTMRHDLSPTGSENRYYLVTAFNGNGEGTAGIAGRDAGLSCAP